MSTHSTVVVAAAAVVTCAGAFFLAPAAAERQAEAVSRRGVELASGRLAQGGLLKALDAELRDLAATVEPSVVYVSAETRVPSWRGAVASSGSGWVWDELGHIVTNAHVVDGAERVQVQDWRGRLIEVDVVGVDLQSDIAVLKPRGIRPEGDFAWVAARRGASRPAQGQMCFAFGSPFDFRFSMSSGIVSGVGRVSGLPGMELENFIQVDAAINPGNSGGPLTDVEARVIGMNTAIASGQGDQFGPGSFAGIGLAIPMEIIDLVVPQLVSTGAVAKGYLGVSVQPVGVIFPAQLRDEASGAAFRAVRDEYRDADGALVDFVEPGSPAEKAGVRRGDVILSIGDIAVLDKDQIPALVATHAPGSAVSLAIWREGKESTVSVVLEKKDEGLNAKHIVRDLGAMGALSLESCVVEREDGALRGVRATTIESKSQWAETVPADAVIVGAGGEPTRNLEELYVRLSRIRGQVRGFRTVEVPLQWVRPSGERGQAVVLLRPER